MADPNKSKSFFQEYSALLTMGVIGGAILTLLIWQISFYSANISSWLSTNVFTGPKFRAYAIYFLSILLFTLIIHQILCRKYPELKKSLTFIACYFCLLGIIVSGVLLSESGKNYQTSLTVLISSIVLGTGWWIQSVVTASSARKSHTLNTIMNQRHSAHYFAKLDNVYKTFGLQSCINEEIASEYYNGHKAGPKIKPELIQGCRDASYILNYYEFIAAGVIRKDFDEALIKECFFEPMRAFEKRTYHLIEVFRREDADESKIYDNFIAVLDRWLTEKSLTTRKKKNPNIALPDNSIMNSSDMYESSATVTPIEQEKQNKS